MKVTISLDDELVKKAREIALNRDTTLTGLIREHLQSLAAADPVSGRKRREQQALERSFEQFRFKVGKRTWKRRDL
jgi:predicted transcriptional regulator